MGTYYSKVTLFIQNKATNVTHRNYSLLLLTLAIFVFLVASLFQTQIVIGDYYAIRAGSLNVNEKYLLPLRGLIYDTNGILLAKNVEKFDLYAMPVKDEGELAKFKDALYKYDPALQSPELDERIAKLSTNTYESKLLTNLDKIYAEELQKSLGNFTFSYFNSGFKRDYLYPETFAHVIGYTGSVTSDDIQKGYLTYEQIGKYKLEAQLEEELRGIRGKSVNTNGVEIRENSLPGNNYYLTLDARWQEKLYEIIENASNEHGAAGGAGVIVDVANGDVKALVSFPGFDPNGFVNGISPHWYEELLVNRSHPLIDKAIGQAAAPGSTLKLVTAYSLLQNKHIDESSRYYSNRCIDLGGGANFCEFGKFFYGDMNVVRAIYKSSNLFFCNYMLATTQGGSLNDFAHALELFNIGQMTGINLHGEVKGVSDAPGNRTPWFAGDTCNAAIGQGAMLVTPLQMAMVVATIENGGVYYQPNILQQKREPDGSVVDLPNAQVVRTVPFSQTTLDLLKSGMDGVAHNPDGTVYYFLHSIGGSLKVKTGTAEVYENINGKSVYRTHGWIVGTFAYEGKTYAFAYHLAFGGGGFYIAKVARDFMLCLQNDFDTNCPV